MHQTPPTDTCKVPAIVPILLMTNQSALMVNQSVLDQILPHDDESVLVQDLISTHHLNFMAFTRNVVGKQPLCNTKIPLGKFIPFKYLYCTVIKHISENLQSSKIRFSLPTPNNSDSKKNSLPKRALKLSKKWYINENTSATFTKAVSTMPSIPAESVESHRNQFNPNILKIV